MSFSTLFDFKPHPRPSRTSKTVLWTFSLPQINSCNDCVVRSQRQEGNDVHVLYSRTQCQLSRWLCGHSVRVVNTTPTPGRLFNFRKRRKKWKTNKKFKLNTLKFRVCIVFDFEDTGNLNLAIQNLCENKKICETVSAYLFGVQEEALELKIGRTKISWNCSFRHTDLEKQL